MKDSVDRGQLKDMRSFLRDADIKSVKEIFIEIEKYEYRILKCVKDDGRCDGL